MSVVAGGAVPRRICPDCKREIAIPGGRFSRHDPPDRGPGLVSCPGSLKSVPLFERSASGPAGTVPLFDLFDFADSILLQEPLDAGDGGMRDPSGG
jgi:hypothetical protein